jgi:hypothetical protein
LLSQRLIPYVNSLKSLSKKGDFEGGSQLRKQGERAKEEVKKEFLGVDPRKKGRVRLKRRSQARLSPILGGVLVFGDTPSALFRIRAYVTPIDH